MMHEEEEERRDERKVKGKKLRRQSGEIKRIDKQKEVDDIKNHAEVRVALMNSSFIDSDSGLRAEVCLVIHALSRPAV